MYSCECVFVEFLCNKIIPIKKTIIDGKKYTLVNDSVLFLTIGFL